jgi:hypothetical protein
MVSPIDNDALLPSSSRTTTIPANDFQFFRGSLHLACLSFRFEISRLVHPGNAWDEDAHRPTVVVRSSPSTLFCFLHPTDILSSAPTPWWGGGMQSRKRMDSPRLGRCVTFAPFGPVPAEPPPSTMASVIAIKGPPVLLIIMRAAMEKGGSPAPPYLSSFTPPICPRRYSMSQSNLCVSVTCEVDSPLLNFDKRVVYLKLWYCCYI